MKKQQNTAVAVTDVAVYLTIAELVVLKNAWQDIMAYDGNAKDLYTAQNRSAHIAKLKEYDIFMNKIFGDVETPEDVHQTLFSPEELPVHPGIVDIMADLLLQQEIDRNSDAHSAFLIESMMKEAEEYSEDFKQGNQDFNNV